MDKQTDERTENLPILQDFVPYQGRCPASPHENQGISSPKASNGQRFPFPAQLVLAMSSFFVCMERIRAAAPIADKVHRMGRFLIRLSVCLSVYPSIHPSVQLSICPSVHLEAWLAGSEAWLAGFEAWLTGPEAWLAGLEAWLAGSLAWLTGPEAWLAWHGWLAGRVFYSSVRIIESYASNENSCCTPYQQFFTLVSAITSSILTVDIM